MTETVIDMAEANRNSRGYGILFESVSLHPVKGAKHNPNGRFLVKYWTNTERPNISGVKGKYIDPWGQATDSETFVNMGAQATVIALHRDPNAPTVGKTVDVEDTVYLRMPDGSLVGPYLIAQKPLHDPHLVTQRYGVKQIPGASVWYVWDEVTDRPAEVAPHIDRDSAQSHADRLNADTK